MTMTPAPPHPAKFSQRILDHLAAELHRELIPRTDPLRVLDPFAGVGGVHQLAHHGDIAVAPIETVGVELEPEWAEAHPDTIVGDARHLVPGLFARHSFDAVVTSPAYGNRMADSYDGRDGTRRHTYRCALGRELTAGNGGGLHWGASYRNLHLDVWRQVWEVLVPGGLFLLNVKNHIRKGEEQRVVEWHVGAVTGLGFHLDHIEVIPTAGLADGANAELRTDGERVVSFRKPRRAR